MSTLIVFTSSIITLYYFSGEWALHQSVLVVVEEKVGLPHWINKFLWNKDVFHSDLIYHCGRKKAHLPHLQIIFHTSYSHRTPGGTKNSYIFQTNLSVKISHLSFHIRSCRSSTNMNFIEYLKSCGWSNYFNPCGRKK